MTPMSNANGSADRFRFGLGSGWVWVWAWAWSLGSGSGWVCPADPNPNPNPNADRHADPDADPDSEANPEPDPDADPDTGKSYPNMPSVWSHLVIVTFLYCSQSYARAHLASINSPLRGHTMVLQSLQSLKNVRRNKTWPEILLLWVLKKIY